MSHGLYRRAYRAMDRPSLSLEVGPQCLVVLRSWDPTSSHCGEPVALRYGASSPRLRSGLWLWIFPEIVAWSGSRRDPRRQNAMTGNATAERLRTTTRFGHARVPMEQLRPGRPDGVSRVLLVRFMRAAEDPETPPRSGRLPQVFAREFFASADDFTRFGRLGGRGRAASASGDGSSFVGARRRASERLRDEEVHHGPRVEKQRVLRARSAAAPVGR